MQERTLGMLLEMGERVERAKSEERRVVGVSTPMRSAEEIALEMVDPRPDGTFWVGDTEESVVLTHPFSDTQKGVEYLRRVIARTIQRARDEGAQQEREKAWATAQGLVDRWVGTSEGADAKARAGAGVDAARQMQRAATLALCAMDVRAAFGLTPGSRPGGDGREPTPTPEDAPTTTATSDAIAEAVARGSLVSAKPDPIARLAAMMGDKNGCGYSGEATCNEMPKGDGSTESEPTARDAVAGMLLRLGFVDSAKDLADGTCKPGEIVDAFESWPCSTRNSGRAIAALEALDRGGLHGARDYSGIAAVNQRLRRERDEARAEVKKLRQEVEEWRGAAEMLANSKKSLVVAVCEAIGVKASPAVDLVREVARARDAAYQRGQEDMREWASTWCDSEASRMQHRGEHSQASTLWRAYQEIRAIPIANAPTQDAETGRPADLASLWALSDTWEASRERLRAEASDPMRHEALRCADAGEARAFDVAVRELRTALSALRTEPNAPTASASEDTGEADRRGTAETAGAGESVARGRDDASARAPQMGDIVIYQGALRAVPAVVLNVREDLSIDLRELSDFGYRERVPHGVAPSTWRFRD